MEDNRKKNSNDDNKMYHNKVKQQEELRDTNGDTKVFQVIRKEDIEREKRRQAIEKENQRKKNSILENKKVVQNTKQENIKKVEDNQRKDTRKRMSDKNISENSITNKAHTNVKVFTNGEIIVKNKDKHEQNNVVENSKTIQNKGTNQILGDVSKQENKDVKVQKNTNVALATNKVLEKNPAQYNNYQENNKKTKLNDYEKNIKQNDSVGNTKKGEVLKVILILIIIILIVLIVSTAFGVMNLSSEKIIRGVKVNNINISNLSKEEAIQTLNSRLNSDTENIVTVKRNNYEKTIKLSDIDGKFDVDGAVNSAYNLGRESDIISNNYKTIGVFVIGNNLNASFTYNEELLEKVINEISIDMPDLAIDTSYLIDGNKLIIKNSVDGIKIQKNEFKQNLIQAFSGQNKVFELPTEKAEQQKIDIKKIYDEVYKAPKNAYYTTNPYKVYKEENGLDFAVSIEEAQQILNENRQEYEIPLKEIIPEIKVADLGEAAFPDLLSTFTTNYGVGDVNRNANIALAAQSINSVVVMPGEVFSYNELIGDCSLASGYKESTIYLNGKLSTGVGGGICQVSTTLYNAVLRANLEIVQRRNHSLGVTYVPAGQDAMVNIGTSDFKFKNNRDYPIEVIAYVNPGSVTCAIRGLKQDVEYEVKLESTTIEKTDTRYKVETYKVLYLNGNVVSRTWLSTDTYKYH